MKKLIFIDTETTGVDTETAGVWQIGGIIRCGKRREEFQFECDIFEGDQFEESATGVTGITLAKLETLPDPKDVYDQFIALLDKYVDRYDKKDKFIAVGYGAEFDQKILRSWFEKNDDDYFGSWFWHPWLCMMNAVAFRYQDKRDTFPNFKLQTVMEHLGLENSGKFHEAIIDAEAAEAIYDHLANGIESLGMEEDVPF